MARLLVDAKCRLCRAEGQKLYLKGARCFSPKCSLDKKATPPGMHGAKGHKKITDYGLQLRAKQKAKRIYGVLEKQFKNYYLKAKTMKGKVGDNLMAILERRLDNTVYLSGVGLSRSHSRQLILHRHVKVNGKIVNIGSFLVKPGQTISFTDKLKASESNLARLQDKDYHAPEWLEVDSGKLTVNVRSTPRRDDIKTDVNENLIIEYYSR